MKPVLITSGEPAGIGLDICLQLAKLTDLPFIVLADRKLIKQRSLELKIDIIINEYHLGSKFLKNVINIIHVPCDVKVIPGVLNNAYVPYVIEMLQTATKLCMSHKFDALVTAPVHKGNINSIDKGFFGHTEFFAQLTNTSNVVMLLACETMKVALATTHIPLKDVPSKITTAKLEIKLNILYNSLKKFWGLPKPHIKVAGLNPHAGENGILGCEEQQIIIPLIQRLSGVSGPYPADTMFCDLDCDAFFAMYHDQGLAVLKYASFGRAANITLGLPFIRTSVDHGTALELAGSGKASYSSLEYAVREALRMQGNL